jgi:arabinogalactan oligomer/maltooligosaccharide transport system substrate-binding protein
MDSTKKCPRCAEIIPAAATTCEYCGALFEVVSTGYCTNCHTVREADETGHCRVCGNEVADWHVESRLFEPAASSSEEVPAAHIPAPTPPKKRTWIWWAVGGGIAGLVACVAIIVVSVLLLLGDIPLPTSPLVEPTFAPQQEMPAPPEPTARPEGINGTITLWYSYAAGSADENALLIVIQNAEAENPGLHVAASNRSSSGNYIEEYKAAALAGAGPDIFISDSGQLGTLLNSRTVLGLDSAVSSKLTGMKQYALDALTVNGTLYGLPESASTLALYYNRSMVEASPASTDDLILLVKKGQMLDIPSGSAYFLYGFWNAFGGRLMDENGRCIADQGGFVPAMQYWLDLQKAGANIRAEYSQAMDRFKVGGTAMTINGPWMLSDFESALGADLGVALLPAGPAGPSRPLTSNNAFFINPKASDPGNAVELALYLTTRDSAQIFMDKARHIPVRNDVYTSDPLIETFSLAATLGTPFPTNMHMAGYWGPFDDLFIGVLSGGTTAEDGVQRACDAMNSANGMP